MEYLALVVAILTFIVTYSQYNHNHKSQEVKLKVDIKKHVMYKYNIEELQITQENDVFNDYSHPLPIYTIIVTNIGNVPVYIQEVGVTLKNSTKKRKVLNINKEEHIALNANKEYSILLNRQEPLLDIKNVYVQDQTGKKFNRVVTSSTL